MNKKGYSLLELKLPTDYTEELLRNIIKKELKIKEFSYTIERKSLDARKKSFIHFLLKVGVSSYELKIGEEPAEEKLHIPKTSKKLKAIVVGSGPAGYFSAYVLSLAGFNVTLLEQGKETLPRIKDIDAFEKTGNFLEGSNYAFGEGGAGTFSDGKLTSRTKTIDLERKFVFDTYIKSGAPEEIAYLSSPHIGSDNLFKMMPVLRKMYEETGSIMIFNQKVTGLESKSGKVLSVQTHSSQYEADYFIFAFGHSSYDTYRMLIDCQVKFNVKTFAVGTRVEHSQEEINMAQWKTRFLSGVKAAEYKLSFSKKNSLPCYSFCMCPGGKIVPAASQKGRSVVNGVSNYLRNSKYANSAIVTSFHLNEILKKEVSPLEALDWVDTLEQKVYTLKNNYDLPANSIGAFIDNKVSGFMSKSSYPFGLFSFDFKEIFSPLILSSLKSGLKEFCNKIRGFENGLMIGLETKTSSPIQVLRDDSGKCAGFENLYVVGEGSGWAGGIVSSAADGIKRALSLLREI